MCRHRKISEVSHSLVQVIRMRLTSVGLIVPKWLHMQDPNISGDSVTLLEAFTADNQTAVPKRLIPTKSFLG